MGKKTVAPIKWSGKTYKIVKGSTSGTSVTLTFDSKIIAIFYYYGHGESSYYVNPNVSFFDGYTSIFDSTYPASAPKGYYSSGTYSISATKVSDYSVTLKYSSSASRTWNYTAILEADVEPADKQIYLLNNTVLYTDGTVSSGVSGAIQTIETDKYKIKANALVTITGSTYINISN